MIYHPQKGHGYGHVTVLKFCRLLCRDAAHRVVLSVTAELLIQDWSHFQYVNVPTVPERH